jgi:tRNA A58 N-methylase Trm61
VTSSSGYALGLDDEEHARLRAQAANARDREEQLWPRLGIRPGAKVADLGCGSAATLLGLTSLVGPSGSLVGVDSNPEAVTRARQDITAAGAETVAVGDTLITIGATGDTSIAQ